MPSVRKFLQFVESLDEQKNAQRFTIFNHLRNLHKDEEELKPQLIEDFYLTALKYEHWQKNISELSHQFEDLLQRFHRHAELNFDPQTIKHGSQWQLVKIRDNQEALMVLEQFLKRHFQDNNIHIKLAQLTSDRILAILGHHDKIKVNVFTPYFVVKGGHLKPLNPSSRLSYNMDMELTPNVAHYLEVGPHTSAIICYNQNRGLGEWVRGYSLQSHNRFQFQNLKEVPEVHKALKKIEYHYILPASDEDYGQLVKLLEKSTILVSESAPGFEKLAHRAITEAYYALENLFPNDKYIKLLLSQLELSLVKREKVTEDTLWQRQELKTSLLD